MGLQLVYVWPLQQRHVGSQAGPLSTYVLDMLVERGAVSHHRLGVGWPRWLYRPDRPVHSEGFL